MAPLGPALCNHRKPEPGNFLKLYINSSTARLQGYDQNSILSISAGSLDRFQHKLGQPSGLVRLIHQAWM